MFVLEYKVKASKSQFSAIDEAIRTVQFVRNKCIRYWMDHKGINKYDLSKLCKQLAEEFDFAGRLNSQARQASSERAWSAIHRFYTNCQNGVKGKKGYPTFQKNNRKDIKRVRLIRRADGYYCQFCTNIDVTEKIEPSKNNIGLDVGLESFYTDSDGHKEPNPRFFRKGEKELKRCQRRLSKKEKGSSNRRKARQRLAKKHLRISRQRSEHAKRLARCVVRSNDLIAYEDLKVRNLVKNHNLAKSISDVGWYQFRVWLEYFASKFGKVTVAVPPQYTSQKCSHCGRIVKKALSTRTHACQCGANLDRDENAAINILREGLRTTGHVGTAGLDPENAWGDLTATVVGQVQSQQVGSSCELSS
jgi:putative transposase